MNQEQLQDKPKSTRLSEWVMDCSSASWSRGLVGGKTCGGKRV